MSKNVTIFDVAKKAGLSIKTVSRALNDEPHVRPVTREKVLAAAKGLNYKPNISARSLAGTRSYIIGLIYNNPSPAYIMGIQEGVLASCESRGYHLLVHPSEANEKAAGRDIDRLIEHSKLDGIILMPPLADNKKLLNRLVRKKIKHVRISQLPIPGASINVSSNEREISFALTKYLISLGHRKIALIRGPSDHSGSLDRYEGFMAALEEAGIKVPANYVQAGNFTFESGMACTTKLLNFKSPPTAIFASNDYMAAGVANVAHEMKLDVPGQVSIAGFDDAPVSRQIWPLLTTVKQPIRQLASKAAEILIRKIHNQLVSKDVEPLACEIIIRNSTGPVPARNR